MTSPTRSPRTGTAIAAAGLSLLLCGTAAAPAAAATPTSWEYQALGLAAAQKTAQGEGITVAVLDSGVEADHPALAGRVTTGPDFFHDGLQSGNPNWGAHGTAMASDVLKVAPQAKILSVRVLDENKEHPPSRQNNPLAEGIDYAVDHGANVISLSLGGDQFGNYDDDDVNALARAANKGIPVIASAGNDGAMFNDTSFPAGYPGVIAVAATQKDGNRADFSTVRSYNAIAAPGVDIASAKNTGGFANVSGTSPAAALTSGVVALMLSHNDKLTPTQVRELLTTTAHHPAGGRNPLVGAGQINAAAAVQGASSPPADKSAATKYTGKEYPIGTDGTPKKHHPPMQTGMLAVGCTTAGVGLLMVVSAVLIGVLARKRAKADAAAPSQGPLPFAGPPR
ncbi:S8 family serine peptidase [Streptomyces yunnanensis]|uniref:S8 family serine peptidase n=1 Tax=Streptomyces yunnanensis TaxID=156453 RepID=A0ABY8A994_9ACTN|nr:S8 family serine peptidase [Streptomyces yunnanensis]WEB40107.1 S8 family serine peptidase [Streptomyces yunnanensis]